MHKRALLFLIVFAVLLSSAAVYFFWIMPSLDSHVDWYLYGSVVDGEGNMISTVEFTIYGNVYPDDNKNFDLTLRIVFPDTFQYRMDDPDGPATEYYSFASKYLGVSYYPASSFVYDRNANKSVFANFALCTYQEFFILDWDDSMDRYLVASTNPNSPPETIMRYFQVFRREMAFDD